MRTLVVKPRAERAIFDVADWLAQKYFPDTGIKFIEGTHEFLLDYCKLSKIHFPLCKNQRLSKKKFSCLVFKKKWIIAFRYTATELIVHEFIWGPKLK